MPSAFEEPMCTIIQHFTKHMYNINATRIVLQHDRAYHATEPTSAPENSSNPRERRDRGLSTHLTAVWPTRSIATLAALTAISRP